MPRNLKGGNKAKKKSNRDTLNKSKKDIPYPDAELNEHVAKVTSVLGDKRFNILFISDTGLKNETMLSHLSRTASKRQGRIIVDSIVKVSKRDFENKCDILYQYDSNEVQVLMRENIISNDEISKNDDDTGIEFTDGNNEEFDISNI